MGNPVKSLREAIGWNQADFARAIGRSIQSVQGYERGRVVPRSLIEKMKSLAVQHGLADIAVELSSDEWQVRRVFDPGETLISQARSKKTATLRAPRTAPDDRATSHQMLDEIYDSGQAEVVAAVRQNLKFLREYLRLHREHLGASRKKR